MKQTKMIYVCRSCGYYGPGVKKQPGSPTMGCLLLIAGILTCGVFLIPWFIYELWRLTNNKLTCPVCGNRQLLPETSPIAKKIIKDYEINTEEAEDDVIRISTKAEKPEEAVSENKTLNANN